MISGMKPPKKSTPSLSFVIPAYNEEESISVLTKEILSEVQKITPNYEIIFIDDGSTDRTFEVIKKLISKNKKIKVVRHRGNWGKSIALQNGFNLATGDIIFTLDADLQDDPQEIPNFLAKLNEGYDLVTGWKKTRHDPPSKVIPSRIINTIASQMTGIKIHDTNCGFKAYRKEVAKNLNLYGELYRYIPIFASKQNFRVTEIAIHHRPRKFGKSKFGWSRGVKGILDLITVFFLTGYAKRPGHFFGSLGILSFFFGFLIGLYITYLRVTTGGVQYRYPLLFLGMLLMIIGVQMVTTGLIAEMIVNQNSKKKQKNTIAEIL